WRRSPRCWQGGCCGCPSRRRRRRRAGRYRQGQGSLKAGQRNYMSILQGLLLTTISSDAQDAEVVLRLLPDEVIVRNVDKGLAKLEVVVALGFADVARHLVQVGAR